MPTNLNPSDADTTKFKVAAIQAEPVWLDLEGGVEKTIKIIREAAAEGAKIIGFPEVFIPGYPWTPWANNFVVTQAVLKEYQANSMALHSKEMDRIREAVREAGVNVVLGFSERDGGSLYIAQVTITADWKIKPTHYEKTVFGDGSAQSIYNVVQTPYGRLGSLNCWEHIQPWLKTVFYSQHPQIFVGGWWPAFVPHAGGSPYIVSGEASSRMSQLVSMEGGIFGIVCCQVVSEVGAEKMKVLGYPWFTFPGGGFSVVIVYADISLDKINEVKLVADIMGNYSRFDLFHTEVHGKNWLPITHSDKEEEEKESKEQRADIDNER
ncbi:nitrilase [Armillaria luteobubalina]|uniref:Nitrilase n=1 Tax=Armillaria luteobubalina TaxID=153913 RepID=A0AA39PHF9_9AGAR|nr:nitrilase [Armillaria luteobubalina]